ncbi:MAG: hypothetical protein ACRC1M_00355 [Methanobacteriaceae archaeon]
MKISKIILLSILAIVLIVGLIFVFGENTRQINDLNLTSNYNYLILQEDNDSVVYLNIFNLSESFTVRKSTLSIISNSASSTANNGINSVKGSIKDSVKDNSIVNNINNSLEDSGLGDIGSYVPKDVSNYISNKVDEVNKTVSTTLSEGNIRESFNNYVKNSEKIKLNNNMTVYYFNSSIDSVPGNYYYFEINGNYYEVFSTFQMSDELLNDLLKNNNT